ncbi:calcineurin-like phosphoesterase C-terminal domain-containing protein [Myroides sp. LJL115]
MKSFIHFCIVLLPLYLVAQTKVSGVVFEDLNNDGIWQLGEPTLEGVVISNGQQIVQSDKNGFYQIDKIQGRTVFVVQPKGYSSQYNTYNVAQFYIDFKQIQDISTYDFPLYKQDQSSYEIALLGDLQVDVSDDIFHIEHLVVKELIEQKPSLIFPLGDLSFDNLDIFDSLGQSLALVGSPVYYVIGNHDIDFDKPLLQRDESFAKVFGPSYYAFEYAQELFVVLNNILPTNNNNYVGALDQVQKEFLQSVLTHYGPRVKTLKIMMHIPLEFMEDKHELLAMVSGFEEVFFASGHTHTQYHRYYPRQDLAPVHQLVAGALCGSWWQGPHDLQGIPFALMYDGTRKGYWTIKQDLEGKTALSYKVSGQDHKDQMHIWTPQQRQWDTLKNQLNDQYVYANVFAGDQNTLVEVSLDGQKWHPMEYYQGVDPFYQGLSLLEQAGRFSSLKSAKVNNTSVKSNHLWRYEIPEDLEKGKYIVYIRAKNPRLSLNHQSVSVYEKK